MSRFEKALLAELYAQRRLLEGILVSVQRPQEGEQLASHFLSMGEPPWLKWPDQEADAPTEGAKEQQTTKPAGME